jgi:prephenate dehydrogenase
MKTIGIVGVGLIGGSFALAMRKAGFSGVILGVSSAKTLDLSIQLRVIDEGVSLEEAAKRSDLIYLSQPICRIIETFPLLNQWVRSSALVTDAGSTKSAILQAAKSLTACQFLGGHPLAGKESRGVSAATADLFADRTYVLTPFRTEDMQTAAVSEFVQWLQRIEAIPLVLDAAEHDRVLAHTSHLPQVASTALAAFLQMRGEGVNKIFGPALLDMTRLALSPFDIWSDILKTNKEEIDLALAGYIGMLEELRRQLGTSNMETSFHEAASYASGLRRQSKCRD